MQDMDSGARTNDKFSAPYTADIARSILGGFQCGCTARVSSTRLNQSRK